MINNSGEDIQVSANFNTNYGMTTVTSKYSPLEGNSIKIDGGSGVYENIYTKRMDSFQLNKKIEFITRLSNEGRINFVNQQVNGNVLPPVVIISSNRSGFIKKMLAQFQYWVTYFDNPDSPSQNLLIDPKPFKDNYPGLFYDPLRSGRNLIIVVSGVEFNKYKNALNDFLISEGNQANPGRIMLVGWRWKSNINGVGSMAGFGASRVAAIKFLKASNCPRAWLMDDNVLHINQFPESLAIVEAQMDDITSAIGFAGCTSVAPCAPKDIVPGALGTPYTTGILQQAVLWNINYIKDANQNRNINFNPYFVASNEDISFGEYLGKKGFAYKIYSNLKVIKLTALLDPPPVKKNKPGTSENIDVAELILKIKEILYAREKNYEISNSGMSSPKPFPIESIIASQPKQFTDNKNTVSCQIIEQILVAWIKSASGVNKAIDALFADNYEVGFKQIP
ncbi:hypothetical protein NF27_DC00120 [Candidatus Jidaibacter acanthamoeba]|uniref:Uncharacterized protein n=1 Tax=Candidatus Jidaibacter acanthamoebae TaxID=86105 RepID=A0A0C1QNV8_9RICK|nr:hypothetical protein [Candidatus Jidaibacter acanthamoeba]KIE05733.1 hypothetical protein NF27_DC00120 [Candidatus Jidaibacter acanthamoeba]